MSNLLRSEWIKFRSVRSTVILVVAAGSLVVLIAFFAARSESKHLSQDECEKVVSVPSGGTYTETRPCSEVAGDPSFTPNTANLGDIAVGIPFALFFFGALGVQIIGQEYRFNTIRPTFTATPQRLRVLAAKLVVVTGATAVVTAVMLAACALVGTVMLHPFEVDGTDLRIVGGTILFSIGWTTLGMGVGAILRQPIAAMLILLVEGFVVEQLLLGLLPWTGKFLPFLNGIQMTVRQPNDSGRLHAPLGGGIYLFVVAAVVWGIGAYLVDRRDA